jgi:MFS family permease
MNIFGAITIIIAVFGAITGGFLADFFLPESYPILRRVVILLSVILGGFLWVKVYLAFLSNRAKAHSRRSQRPKPDADA